MGAFAAEQCEKFRIGLEVFFNRDEQVIGVDCGIGKQAELLKPRSNDIIFRQMGKFAVHPVEAHPAGDAVVEMVFSCTYMQTAVGEIRFVDSGKFSGIKADSCLRDQRFLCRIEWDSWRNST